MSSLVLVGSSLTLQPPGAGGGVTAPSLPGTLDFVATEPYLSYSVVNNDGSNPTVVSLSFSPTHLEAANPPAGTAAEPTMGLIAGDTASFTLRRSLTAPTTGGAAAVTVTATFADGTTDTSTVNVYPESTLEASLVPWEPSTLVLMEDDGSGNALNRGSNPRTDSFTPTILTVDSTVETFALGEIVGNNANARLSATMHYDGPNGVGLTQDRTSVWVWKAQGGTASRRLGGAQATGSLIIFQRASGYRYSLGSEQSFDASFDHTDGGSSENLGITSGRLCVLMASYEAATNTMTFRWKQTSHRAGHSFRTTTGVTTSTSTSNITWYPFGAAGNAAATFIGYGHAVLGRTVSEAEFSRLLASVGLS